MIKHEKYKLIGAILIFTLVNSCKTHKPLIVSDTRVDTLSLLLKAEVSENQYLKLKYIELKQQFAEHLRNDSIIANNTSNSNNLENVLPSFPNPPPQASAKYIFNVKQFISSKTYGDIQEYILICLNHGGYADKLNYFLFDNGFAIATDMEQVNSDATPKSSNERWLKEPVNEFKETWTIKNYINQLFNSKPGYYRTIVFIVSNSLYTFSPNDYSKDLFSKYISQGAIGLPAYIKTKTLLKNTSVTALIYEFKKPENSENALLITDAIGGFEQLKRSSIINY